MSLTERIEQLIAPSIEAMGFAIVRVRLMGQQRQQLQIMAEPLDGRAMIVEDCAEISRAVSAVLDVEDPIKGAYTLEVSSPGIDRPLVRLRDFERFAGHEARVELGREVEGRKRFRGTLKGIENDTVHILMDAKTVELPFADIVRAKLVLTDALLAESEEQRTS
jgi:ribosome maturation factor RimP